MRVLGIEGTAWAASAAVFDTESNHLRIETDPYVPDSGGIHPREAAEHMAEAIPRVIERVITRASEADTGEGDGEGGAGDRDGEGGDHRSRIDAVAFSQGPGLGPCLRIVASAARAFALSRDVPLVGVNHMIAHAEIGRDRSGFDAPICLNASGANAHLLGYRNGRYRIFGETMDTGIGNTLDKFARHLDWSHPGGPKVEVAAEGGSYLPLPYVVKGMDFSFSGLMSAAKAAVDDGESVEDVCFSLQETAFSMLTEVAERALSLTGATELVLGGGVGRNARLRGMLSEMCTERGARFYAPEPRLLQDNAGMIAALGAKMVAAGDTLSVPDSHVRPNFRPDEVRVTWPVAEPGGESRASGANSDGDPGGLVGSGNPDRIGRGAIRGAEAVVEIDTEAGRVAKRRPAKSYRHPALDDRLRRERTVTEARLTSAARRLGVATPVVQELDLREWSIAFEYVGSADLRGLLGADTTRSDGTRAADGDAVVAVAEDLAALHGAGVVHGDPTTRNVRVTLPTGSRSPPKSSDALGRTYLIDFGLGYHSDATEDHAMDLHVFAQSLAGTTEHADRLRERFEDAYAGAGDQAVLDRLREIEGRGRYQ